MARRLKVKRMSAGVVVLLVIAGWASINEIVARKSTLIGPTWGLVSIRQGKTVTNLGPDNGRKYTIKFVMHDAARLKLDCNSGTAGWSASLMRRVLRIGEIRATNLKCPDAGTGNAVLMGLAGDNTYGVTDDGSTLLVRSDRATFTFQDMSLGTQLVRNTQRQAGLDGDYARRFAVLADKSL